MPPKEPISDSTDGLKVALARRLDAGLGGVRRGDVDAGVAVVHGKRAVYRQTAARPARRRAPPAADPGVVPGRRYGSTRPVRSADGRPASEFAGLERTLEERRQQVEAALRRLVVPGRAEAVEAAIESSLFAPAKRLRPILALLVAEVLKGDPEAVLPAGCAIEMVHTASLILDDLPSMDDADDAPRPAHLPRGPRRGDRDPRRLRAPEPRLRDPGRGLGGRPRRRGARRGSRASSAARSAPTA